jgi:hypothetical protein
MEVVMRPLIVAALSAVCVGSISAAASTPLLDPAVALDGRHDGATVLWGGRVFARTDSRCLEVAALPLRSTDGRPVGRDRVREGQHFIACGDGFGSTSHPVRSYVTIAGTVHGVEQRVVRAHCGNVIYADGRQDYGSSRREVEHACELALPIVDVADSRSWREDPTPSSMPSS